MVNIKEIYRHYNLNKNTPYPPRNLNLTPLQIIEWKEENSQLIKDYNNKSFVGELLTTSPAVIENIMIDKIIANANYKGDYYYNQEGTYRNYETFLEVNYEIFYDKSFYNDIKLIHNNSMIELEGKIIKFSRENKRTKTVIFSEYPCYKIQLNLSSIKVIVEKPLSIKLLDESYKDKKYENPGFCFIATAAFGNQDITEVIQLRKFRDEVLRHFFIGRCFIFLYGILSPPIALIIKNSNWLRKITRNFLRKVVLPITTKDFKIKK